MFDPQLAQQLKQIVAFTASAATANAYGEVVQGSIATAYCRMEFRTRSTERADGTFQVTRAPLLVMDVGVTTPQFETLYWLPGTSPHTATFGRRPKSIEPLIDENGGVDHWELSF